MAAARAQILASLDIGLYSLFGQYDKELLQKYDVFVLDGSQGGGSLKLAEVYDNMEAYIKPVLRQNSQKLFLQEGGFTGYRLLTDEKGEIFYHQVVEYMQETLGIQGIRLLTDRMQDRQNKTEKAEQEGQEVQSGGSLESYEQEMNQAARKSQEAEQAQAEKEGTEPGNEASPPADIKEVKNPISTIKRIMKMGILELVIPPGKGVSDGNISKHTVVSERKLQSGMPLFLEVSQDNSYTSQLLYQQYLMDKFGNYQKPGIGALKYQIEYVLSGKDNDLDNLKAVAGKLLLVREGVNFAHILADSAKRAQIEALALAIASAFLIPPAAAIIEGALILCWAFAESVLDVRELMDGGKVPLVKSASDWQLSLEKLPDLLGGLDTERKGNADGMSYEDYLQVFLIMQGKGIKLSRGMDMFELSVRSLPGRSAFCMDSCISAIEAFIDVQANGRKIFTATKQYSYL